MAKPKHKIAYILLILYFKITIIVGQESCSAGIGTKYDGFQNTFMRSAHFSQDSILSIKSPFMMLNSS